MVRRRQLGAALRRYRLEARMSVNSVAESLLCSAAKISRIENAQRKPTLRDVRDLCDLYGITDPALREQFMSLAREGRERGWWQDAELDPALEALIGMEGSANKINEFEILTVPGLLQTRAYADAILEAWIPNDPMARKAAADVRMQRQEILEGPGPPELCVILDEAAIARMVGGPVVMRNQLEHMWEKAASDRIEVRVVPFSRGAHVGASNGFTLLEFDQPPVLATSEATTAVVYIEALERGAFHDQPPVIERYQRAFDQLRRVALDSAESRKLLHSRISGLASVVLSPGYSVHE